MRLLLGMMMGMLLVGLRSDLNNQKVGLGQAASLGGI